MLLDPAENAGGELLEAVHRHTVVERHEQRIHDALKDVELDLVRHLIFSLLWVVLVGLHYVLVVPIREDKDCWLKDAWGSEPSSCLCLHLFSSPTWSEGPFSKCYFCLKINRNVWIKQGRCASALMVTAVTKRGLAWSLLSVHWMKQ